MAVNAAQIWFLVHSVVVVKWKFVKLSNSSCDKWTWTTRKQYISFVRQDSITQHEDGFSFNFNEESRDQYGVVKWKIIKLRNTSFGNGH